MADRRTSSATVRWVVKDDEGRYVAFPNTHDWRKNEFGDYEDASTFTSSQPYAWRWTDENMARCKARCIPGGHIVRLVRSGR